jgi:hypothetical protein
MHSSERERIHVVINTHNRLSLIRQTIPRILSATASDDCLTVTHSVYDDESDKGTRDYLLSLMAVRKIDNLILGSGELSEYRVIAQTNNPCIANYLQVLRACLFVAPASWVLHFTDDALIRFTGLNSRWLQGWVSIMRAEPRIISVQMTDYDVNLLESLSGVDLGLPACARIHRTNFVSDRYTLYRYSDLLAAFECYISSGQYPLAFEGWLTNHYLVAEPNGRWATVCQWDDEYVGTHVGAPGAGITFTEQYVAYLVERLDRLGPTLSLSARVEFG